jgi:uncharacterized membrane protein YgcG
MAAAVVAARSLTVSTHASQTPAASDPASQTLVDVRAIDKDGVPVLDLAASDFVVTVDAKPIAVRTAFSPPTVRTPRTVMLLIDDLSVQAEPMKALLVPAARMLASLDASDLVGLATTSGLGPQVTPTRDRAAVTAALQSKDLVGRADPRAAKPFVGASEAFDMVRTNGNKDTGVRVIQRECGGGSGGAGGSRGGSGGGGGASSRGGGSADDACVPRIVAAARAIAMSRESITSQQLNAITTVAKSLGKSATAGPRTLVLLTGGVALPLGTSDATDVVAHAAGEAHVAVYGLVAIDDSDLTSEASSDRIKARHEEDNYLVAGTESLAAAAFGEATRMGADADHQLARMVAEAGGEYHLAIDAPSGTRDRFINNVKVASKRPGVTIRAALSAVHAGAPAPQANPDALKQRIESGGTAFGVPIALTTSRRRDSSPTRVQLAVNVEAPASTPAPVSAMFALIDGSGKVVQSGKKDLPATPGDSFRLSLALPVDAADYRLRVALQDGTGSVGSLDDVVSTRLPRAGSVATSDLMATSSRADGPPHLLALETLPDRAQTLHVALELYPETSDTSAIKVRLTIAPAAGGPALVDGEVPAAMRDGRLVVSAALPAGALKPDRYLITATVLDAGKPAGTVTTTVRKVG